MAQMTAAQIDDLPDSAFAYIEPGGKKDDSGRTVPRSLRHFPINDAAHVRNALARLAASPFGERARARVEAAARRMGIGEPSGKGALTGYHAARGADLLSGLYQLIGDEAGEDDQVAVLQHAASDLSQWIGMEAGEPDESPDDADEGAEAMMAPGAKAFFDMKAEPLAKSAIARWLAGEVGRRILVVPFTGPLPGGKAGLDLDGEYFDEATDLYGGHAALRASPWRLMDWHHDDAGVPPPERGGPPISMKSVLIGEIELEDDPDEFGRWAQWWVRQGRINGQRIGASRVAALQEMGAPVYGSSLATYKQKASDGHIEVWPIIRHTASTSPRNTHAAIPALKALLTAEHLPLEEIRQAAIKAALLGLYDGMADLRPTYADGAASTFTDGAAMGAATPAVDPRKIAQAGVAAAIRGLARH